MTNFKPLLAKDCPLNDDGTLKVAFPIGVQTKYDGIRASVVDGKLVTRTLKEVQNREIFVALSRPEFEGLDGEIIVGDPTAEGCFGRTTSFVMSRDKTGENWAYYVFDKWNETGNYARRHRSAKEIVILNPLEVGKFVVAGYKFVENDAELMECEKAVVEAGHEGVILRTLDSPYKFGRSGLKGPLLKVKRFKDGEARIINAFEQLHNANEAKKDAFGRTERSSHKANKIPKGCLGGFEVEDIVTGQRFNIGTGFTQAQREELWALWHEPGSSSEAWPDGVPVLGRWLRGRIAKYKHFPVGEKDLPRFPVFLGFRDESDM